MACLVDLQAMRTVATTRLQYDIKGVRSFVGDVRIDGDGLVIAGPFSRDVLLLDRNDFTIIARAHFGYEPLQAVQLAGAEMLARDWKSGAVLRGSFVQQSKS
jgi:hypothetical protein